MTIRNGKWPAPSEERRQNDSSIAEDVNIGNGDNCTLIRPFISPQVQCFAAAIAIFMGMGTAHAQDSTTPPPTSKSEAQPAEGYGEIIVTAQKRSENALKVPIAISAFSGDTLNAVGVQGVQGLQVATPALVYPNTGAYAQPYIRGVGSRLLQNGLDPSVATYIDGRYISRQSAVVFDLADIERVEVLKGPQGVLFGRNSSAGAIRVITKDVAKNFEGYIKGGYGNYNLWTISGALNVPLTSTLGLRLSGATIKHDGYAHNIVNTGRQQWDDKNFREIRGKLKWEPTSDVTALLTVGYAYRNDDSGNDEVALGVLPKDTGIALGGTTGISRDQVATAVKGTNRVKEFSTEFDLTANLKPFDVKSITTYATLHNKLAFDGDGTSARLVDAFVYENTKTFSQEIDVTSHQNGPLTWLAGAYFFYDNTGFETDIDTGKPFIVSQGLQRVKTKSESGFGQVKWQMSDALSLTVGGRYNHETKEVGVFASQNPNYVTVPATPYSDKVAFSKFTPSATLQYDFGQSMVYAKFARGFKSGGFNYPAVGSKPLKPEVLDMYEAGFKGSFFDRAVNLTLSAYYYDYSNLQVTRAAASTTGGGVVVVTENAANAKLYGLDADVTWHVDRNFTLSGGISAQHSKYQNFLADAKMYKATFGMTDVVYDASGHTLLRAPKFSAFASANYDIPIGSGKIPVTVSYSYKGSFDFDFVAEPSTNVLHQKGYSLLNARIGYTPESNKWSASVWANNLTDNKYFDDVVASGTGIRGSYGAPRTYGVELQYNF